MAEPLSTALVMQSGGIGCPPEIAETIRGWGQYRDQVKLLPPAEQEKISKIADLIVTSFVTSNCVPLGQIKVIGHADHDFHGEAFEKKVSDERVAFGRSRPQHSHHQRIQVAPRRTHRQSCDRFCSESNGCRRD